MAEKRRRMPRAAAVGDLLAAIFHGKPAGKRLKEGKIWLIWNDCVGEQIASHARPAAFRDGTLTLCVDSAPWMQQLNFLKKQLMEKLNARLGEELVREIFLKAGTVLPPDPPQEPPQRPRQTLTQDEEARIATLTGSITDDELRDTLEQLIRMHFKSRE